MANLKHVFYMQVSAFDDDIGHNADIVKNMNAIIHWYYQQWALYENDIFTQRLPKMKHIKDNIFKVSYHMLPQNLEKAVIQSEILADPDDELNYPIILDGEFCRIRGVPINIHMNQDQ